MTDDPDYLERRAEAAIRLAQRAKHPAAVRAHYLMASGYLSRRYPDEGEAGRPPPTGGRRGGD